MYKDLDSVHQEESVLGHQKVKVEMTLVLEEIVRQ